VPEGDTIWRSAASLRARLVGKQILKAVPPTLVGRTVQAVEPVGKHILVRFDGGLALHTHLRMSGQWQLYAPGERWRRPAWQVKALLETEDTVAVCFAAPTVELVREGREGLQRLGPDILAAEFDLEAVVARARSSGPVALGELLLDQRVAAGIGNIHKNEALWRTRLDPFRADYTDDELRSLYTDARAGLQASIGGRRPAESVYRRTGRACRRCGTLIRSQRQGERLRRTYWCPTCQA
jgi:endonuclease-8